MYWNEITTLAVQIGWLELGHRPNLENVVRLMFWHDLLLKASQLLRGVNKRHVKDNISRLLDQILAHDCEAVLLWWSCLLCRLMRSIPSTGSKTGGRNLYYHVRCQHIIALVLFPFPLIVHKPAVMHSDVHVFSLL